MNSEKIFLGGKGWDARVVFYFFAYAMMTNLPKEK